jgi:hypothetical protein
MTDQKRRKFSIPNEKSQAHFVWRWSSPDFTAREKQSDVASPGVSDALSKQRPLPGEGSAIACSSGPQLAELLQTEGFGL